MLTWLIAKSLPFPPVNACLVLDLPVRDVWLAGHAGATKFTNVHTTFPYAVDLLKLRPASGHVESAVEVRVGVARGAGHEDLFDAGQ